MQACQKCNWGLNPSAPHGGATNFFFFGTLLICYLDATRMLLIKLWINFTFLYMLPRCCLYDACTMLQIVILWGYQPVSYLPAACMLLYMVVLVGVKHFQQSTRLA